MGEQLLLEPFRHAAQHSDGDLAVLLLLEEPVEAAPDALFGIVPDGTGIDHDKIRFLQCPAGRVAFLFQDGEDYLAVVDIHLTAVCFYEYSFIICHSTRKDNFLYLCRTNLEE